ncbi:hypothetical protein B0H14DRAFT_2496750, partial [Mycena olivaceomarginata]
MLLLLLVYYIGQATFAGSRPIDSDDAFPPSIAARASRSSCPDAENCRTTWNIVWSCLVTIFSCTWVAVHPNIPRPVSTREMSLVQRLRHSLWEFLSNRMLLFVVALLVPEYILAWAIRQRLRAREIAQEHKGIRIGRLLTDFFVIMGGFHLFKPPSPTPEETGRLLQQASIVDPPSPSISGDTFRLPPREPIHDPHEDHEPLRMLTEYDLFRSGNDYQFIVPTEDEIKDRSKSDWLAKSIALIHTTWFLVQCFARGNQRLAITELEIVTGAYAMMNFTIYFFWWKKPLNIGCPVRVIDRQGEPPQQTRVRRHLGETALEYALHVIIGNQDDEFDWRRMPSALHVLVRLHGLQDHFTCRYHYCADWIPFQRYPFLCGIHLIVPLIFSCIVMIIVPVFISIFGWSTLNEHSKLRSRASALANGVESGGHWRTFASVEIVPLAMWFVFIGAFFYIFARVITLTLAFTTLRSLPA